MKNVPWPGSPKSRMIWIWPCSTEPPPLGHGSVRDDIDLVSTKGLSETMFRMSHNGRDLNCALHGAPKIIRDCHRTRAARIALDAVQREPQQDWG
jgi:hypothetical protein